MIEIGCPSCGRWHEFADQLAGLPVVCKGCRHPIRIPAVEQPIALHPANLGAATTQPTAPEYSAFPSATTDIRSPQNGPLAAKPPIIPSSPAPAAFDEVRREFKAPSFQHRSTNKPRNVPGERFFTRRRIVWWGSVALLAGAVIVLMVPVLRMSVVGIFRGEPFHDGAPVSYWISLLDDSDPQTRNRGVTALRQMGPRAEAAVPPLLRRLKDTEYGIRLNAAWSLACIGPDDPKVAAAFDRLLQDEPEDVQVEAAENLYFIWQMRGTGMDATPPDAAELFDALVPTFIDSLQKGYPYTRFRVASLLGAISSECPRAQDAIPALRSALQDQQEHVYPPFILQLRRGATATNGTMTFQVRTTAFGALTKMNAH